MILNLLDVEGILHFAAPGPVPVIVDVEWYDRHIIPGPEHQSVTICYGGGMWYTQSSIDIAI